METELQRWRLVDTDWTQIFNVENQQTRNGDVTSALETSGQ